MRNKNTFTFVTAALLSAIGFVIPMFSPLKIVLEPASFTLGSHVPIFIAMFISPMVALVVSLGAALGFFLGGFPIVVVLRAVTHVVFSVLGAIILQKHGAILKSYIKALIFSLGVGIIHACCEVGVVIPFFFGNKMAGGYYTKGFLTSVIMLVGVGTIIHSMVDFIISLFVWKAITVNNKDLHLRFGRPE